MIVRARVVLKTGLLFSEWFESWSISSLSSVIVQVSVVLLFRKWFVPRSIGSLSSMIVRVSVVLKKTVV